MIHVGKETRRSPQQVLDQALASFGPEGVGLTVERQTAEGIGFQGGGGYVAVRVSQAAAGATTVDIESQEWEYHAEQFLRQL